MADTMGLQIDAESLAPSSKTAMKGITTPPSGDFRWFPTFSEASDPPYLYVVSALMATQ